MNIDVLTYVESQIAAQSLPVPAALRDAFAPAQYCVREWTDYWLDCPGADTLRLGSTYVRPIMHERFRVRFENQLGLATIQPFAGGRPLCPPLTVEVISPKFPTPAQHMDFFRTMLDDLFTRAARLPFTFNAPTGRSVTEALQLPTPLFIYHFLCRFAPALRTAVAIVQASPHRRLHDDPAFVPLAAASEAGADVLINILHTPEEWTHAHGFSLAGRLGGYAPARVWQRRPEETFDTPENRFILSFLREVLAAAETLPAQSWWGSVPDDRRRTVRELAGMLGQSIAQPLFAGVGLMHYFPTASHVLLRREGYRDLLLLWQSFQRSRRPLFAALQQAIEVRDIAQLYEMWAFFALVEESAVLLGESPIVDLRVSDERGLEWSAWARFGGAGTLIYNQYQFSYSVPLRPDFTWIQDGRAELVLDAKFRLERQLLESTEDTPQSTAHRTDLYKMHTYRDALGVRAAVSVYPGDVSVFYDRVTGRTRFFDLRDLLSVRYSGIGAIAMSPAELKEIQ